MYTLDPPCLEIVAAVVLAGGRAKAVQLLVDDVGAAPAHAREEAVFGQDGDGVEKEERGF